MCGITGLVDYRRDLRHAQEIGQAMVHTMACRGPDAEGMWLAPHVVLGHRRLAVIDVAGGAQPMAYHDGQRPPAVLVYSGEVYNFRELRTELAGLGHEFRTRSDTEVLLHAYVRWGAGVVERLNGMYAFAVWDESTQELLLVRDRLGVKPLYYHVTPDGVVFGSEPKAIFATGLLDPAVDLDGLRELFGLVKTPGEAIFAGLRELPPGHLARVTAGGVTEQRYWSLPAAEHTDDLDTTVRTVRDLLADIVRRQLVADVPLGILLSGGLDSSALTALAQRTRRDRGLEAVRTFAVDFAGHAAAFKAEEYRDTADAPFVAGVAKHVGTRHTDVVLASADLLDPAVVAATLTARDLPPFGEIDTSLYLLFKAIREHVTVALSGEAADEVFGGYRWFHLPQVVEAPMFPWHVIDAVRQISLFPPDLAAKLDLTTYIADRYTQALAEVPDHPGPADPHERRMREICYLHLTRYLQMLLDRKDRMSMAVGLETRVPFCDHRLVEYVFNTPWSMKTFDGREKSLLRAAAAPLLPPSVLRRLKSPYPATQDPAYDEALRAHLKALLAEGTAPALTLLDHTRLATLLDRPSTGLQIDRFALEFTLNFNAWLDTYNIRITV